MNFKLTGTASPVLGIAAKWGSMTLAFINMKWDNFFYTTRMYTNFTGKSFVFTSSGKGGLIPPFVLHRAQMRASVGYRSVYLAQEYADRIGNEVMILSISSLLREVLERIAIAPFDSDWQQGI